MSFRTDLEAYDVIENAKYSRTVPNLDEYTEELKDFCFYYLGSSVSFNDRLLSAGIPLRYYDENGDVANTSKYKVSYMCLFPFSLRSTGRCNVNAKIYMSSVFHKGQSCNP